MKDNKKPYPACNMAIINKQTQFKTNDRLIRDVLIKELKKHHAKDSTVRIIEELGINHGTARIDIAVVNGVMHGYEIKSDLDTLARLPEQIIAYNAVFNKVTLVVGWSHLQEAINIIPDWWGITAAKTDNNGEVKLSLIRTSEPNHSQDCVSIAKLLWRDEALDILKQLNMSKGVLSKPRNIIYEKLADCLDQNVLEKTVRETLFFRPAWRVDQKLMQNDGSNLLLAKAL